jgi:hypothetical protein
MKVYLAMDGVTIQYCEDVFAVGKMINMQCSLSSTKYIACNVQYCFITHCLYQHQHCIANVSIQTSHAYLWSFPSRDLWKNVSLLLFGNPLRRTKLKVKCVTSKRIVVIESYLSFSCLALIYWMLMTVSSIRKQWRSNQLSFSNCITNAGL